MLKVKTIIAIILMVMGFKVVAAEQSELNMNHKKTLVISYDYPSEKVLEHSTTKLHQNSEYTFHGEEKDVEFILLGEKQKIIIPDINESFLYFDKNFKSVTLYLKPTGHWSSMAPLKDQIQQMKEKLKPIKDIATKSDEVDMSKLTDEFFEAKPGALICEYELEHYKVFFIMKKLNTPKEIHPRDKEYYQLTIRVDNKVV